MSRELIRYDYFYGDFIPLVTYDYKMAFCQVTKDLPEECQRMIWSEVVPPPLSPPDTPIKPSKRLLNYMDRWAARRLDF